MRDAEIKKPVEIRENVKDNVNNVRHAVTGFGAALGDKFKQGTEKMGDAAAKGLEKSEQIVRKVKTEKKEPGKKKEQKKISLDDELRTAIDTYNVVYTCLNDHGTQLFIQRERAIDLLVNIEDLVNSIANHPKSFDKDISEIKVERESFKEQCEYVKEELQAAQKSAMSAGAGIAGGMAVTSIAPSAAMWIATTFGTASTGTAISSLSGAAATNAALAWLGGGALTAGGGGMAAGNALLALAGPIGWGIAGATLLTSIVLFANKKVKLRKEKKSEIEGVLKNTESLQETDAEIDSLLAKTETLRESLSIQYKSCMESCGKNFLEISEENQVQLGTMVNNAKSLAMTLAEGIGA